MTACRHERNSLYYDTPAQLPFCARSGKAGWLALAVQCLFILLFASQGQAANIVLILQDSPGSTGGNIATYTRASNGSVTYRGTTLGVQVNPGKVTIAANDPDSLFQEVSASTGFVNGSTTLGNGLYANWSVDLGGGGGGTTPPPTPTYGFVIDTNNTNAMAVWIHKTSNYSSGAGKAVGTIKAGQTVNWSTSNGYSGTLVAGTGAWPFTSAKLNFSSDVLGTAQHVSGYLSITNARTVTITTTGYGSNPPYMGGTFRLAPETPPPYTGPFWHVRPTGDDENDGSSSTKAFKTIAKAASVVSPGDTVYIGGGVYRETVRFTRSGTATQPINFVADTTGAKTGSAGAVVIASQQHAQWAFTVNASFLTFKGFRFTGSEMTYVPNSETTTANYPYGVYVNTPGGEVTFDTCEVDSLFYGIHSYYSGIRAQSCNFHDNIYMPLMTHYGGQHVESSVFTGTGHGPRSYRDHYLYIKSSRMVGLSGWALLVAFEPYGNHKPFGSNTATLQNCVIEDNQNGLHLQRATNTDRINFYNSPIKNLNNWELYIGDSDLDITPTWLGLWPISSTTKQNGILTWKSKLRVNGVTFEDYAGQAFYSRYDELTMNNCLSRRNGRGLDIYYPIQAAVNSVQVTNNGDEETNGWGLHLWLNDESSATLTNCRINNNRNGAHMTGVTPSNLTLVNSTIENNLSYGVYFNRCNVTLTPQTLATRWRIANNGHGVCSYYSTMLLDGITMTGNTGWGALLHYGEARVRNCNFTGNGNGLRVYHNKLLEISNCHFDDNETHGLRLAANGMYYDYDAVQEEWRWFGSPIVATIRNCTMDRNHYGLYLERSVMGKLTIDDSPIRDNRGVGLYVQYGIFRFDPNTMRRMFRLEGNQNTIYAGNGAYIFEDLEISNAQGYGLHTWYSDVVLTRCTFSNNGDSGYYSAHDRSLVATQCNFVNSGQFGVRVYSEGTYYDHNDGEWKPNSGPLKFVNCDVANNRHGLYLVYAGDNIVKLENTPIHDNSHYGLYANQCDLTFTPETMTNNWRMQNNGYHIVAIRGKYKFRDLEFADATYAGVSTQYSDVSVENCTFTRNGSYGFQSSYNSSFSMNNCRIFDNGTVDEGGVRSGVGMYLYHGKHQVKGESGWEWIDNDAVASISNTPIEGNGTYGLRIGWGRDENIHLVNSPIRGHRSAGLYVSNCEFAFTPQTMGSKWQLSDNGSHIYACWGTYLFENLTLTNAPGYGAATWGSDVTVRNCSFNENGNGFHAHYNSSTEISNCHFDNNSSCGLRLRNFYVDGNGVEHGGPINVRNSTVDGNYYGLLVQYSDSEKNPIRFENTPISNNRGWAAYFNSCDMTFRPDSFQMSWNLIDNANNFLIYYGTTRFENATLSGAKGWAAYTHRGNVTVTNSEFTGNGAGLLSSINESLTISNSRFNDNRDWGLWVRPYQHSEWDDADGVHHTADYTGTVHVKNVEAKRNSRGMMVYDYNPLRDEIVFDQVSISDSTNEAIRFDYLNGELNATNFAQFDSAISGKNNKHGFMMYYSNAVLNGLTFTGNRGWGGLAYYSKLEVKNCKFNANGNGLLCYTWPTRDDFLVVDNCEFKDNSSSYGLQTYFYPTATITNSTFANNKLDGHYSNYDVKLRTENCVFTGNRQWGVVRRIPDWWQYQANEPGFANPLHTLTDCTIEGNANGLHVQHGQNATFQIQNVPIRNNSGHSLYLSSCQLVLDNQTTASWPMENNGWGPLVNGGDVTFRNMSQTVNSVGFAIWGWGTGTIENCESVGGKKGLLTSNGHATVKNSRFQGDGSWDAYDAIRAEGAGELAVTNSVFSRYVYGVLTTNGSSSPDRRVLNCTFANLKYHGVNHNVGQLEVRNCIFSLEPSSTARGYGMTKGNSATMSHSHNLVHGFSIPFSGISPDDSYVLKEPQFQGESVEDFHLAKGSPAINSGFDTGMYVPLDLEGNVRPAHGVFEMGAYEYTEADGSIRILKWLERQ